jgi:hypothetical protein
LEVKAPQIASLFFSPSIAIKLIHSSSFYYQPSISTTNLNHHQLIHNGFREGYVLRQQASDVIASQLFLSRHSLPTPIELAHYEHRQRSVARQNW